MTRALYRTYRSRSLDEIIGQSHITDVLKKSIEQGRISHAYLLTGPRGVGKTSIARILAHEINHLPYDEDSSHLDIVEIDAASNNGVDDVRELRERVKLAPVSAEKKVYIIDEVHMLSKPAFNALLKTLEEPPEHIVFILATTDIDKLPATIISRVQRYTFRAISDVDLAQHLKTIANAEKIKIEDDALALIARHGKGSFRDSISLLDQMTSLSSADHAITTSDVEQSLGLAPEATVSSLVAAYRKNDLAQIVATLDRAESENIQPIALTHQLQDYIKAIIASSPDLIPLLDSLLSVPVSDQPYLKLLTALGTLPHPPHTTAHTKTAPLSAPTPRVDLGTIPEPKIETAQVPEESLVEITVVKTKNTPPTAGTSPLDWEQIVEATKNHSIALYSLLKKCSHEQSGTSLSIYAGNNFTKKRLDDARHRKSLSEVLQTMGHDHVDIETIAGQPTPTDAKAAAVAAIMGGGEEVNAS